MAQKNRANMLTDIVSNIYNNLINFITGQNAQDRFVNLLDSSPNILSDKDQASGYVGTDANNEMLSGYYIEQLSVVAAQTLIAGSDLVSLKAYILDDADAGNRIIKVLAAGGVTNQFYQYGIDATTGEIGTYDITTDVFTPIVSSAQTLSQTLVLGNTSGANDIVFDATYGLEFDNLSRLREGTIDAGLGGLKGIAQICGAGYELKWENGRLYVMGSSGNTIRQSLYNFTTTPTATDDTTLGYAVGSLWTLDDGTVYECTDDTIGAAVWTNRGIGAGIVYITVAELQALQSTSAISTTTIYVVTDATPFILSMQFKANNQLYATADIMDDNYAGTVLYDSSGGVSQPIIITDLANGNIWNGLFPATTTIPNFGTTLRNTFYQGAENNVLAEDCENNIYEQDASSNTVNKYAIGNTFKQGANGFIFYEYLKNTTIEAGITGADYTAGSYAFLYNNAYPSTIFQSGGINYHRYFDVANDRIVITDLATPANVTYIGGGVASVTAGTNISVTGTSTAPIINSLSDRYSTSSISTNDIDNNNGKIFTVDADLAYIPLQEVLIVNDPTHHMHGTVVSYSGTTLTVDINSHTGSGTFSSWVINIDGVPVDAITGVGTANEIAYFTGGQVIASLDTATYPSLTELSYVKNVGSQVVGTTDTNTLTNKRITARSGTVASSATPTINTDNVDFYSLTAQAADITSFTTNLSGTPTEGQTLWIAITGTAARTIAWGASFESSTITLPTTTVTTNRLDVAFIWNEATSKWRCVGTC